MRQTKGIVDSVSWKGHLKTLRIKPRGRTLSVPISACVSKGDEVKIAGDSAWIVCKNGPAQFLNPYCVEEKIKFGGLDLKVVIKEITVNLASI